MLAAESASQQQISELKKQRTDEASAKTEKAPEKLIQPCQKEFHLDVKLTAQAP